MRSRTLRSREPSSFPTILPASASLSGWSLTSVASWPADHSAWRSAGRAGPCRAGGWRHRRRSRAGGRGSRGGPARPSGCRRQPRPAGARRARVSRKRRPPQHSSATGNCAGVRLITAATRSTMASRSVRAAHRAQVDARVAISGVSSSLIPAASLTISANGQNVMPSPYGRQRPRTSARPPPRRVANSLDQSRLADAGVADDRDERGTPRRRLRRCEGARQRAELCLAARRTGVPSPRLDRRRGVDTEQRNAGDRLGLALERRAARRLDLDGVADQVVRQLADEDLVLAAPPVRAAPPR